MRANNHSSKRTVQRRTLCQPTTSSGAETAVFVILGTVSLVAIMVALVSGSMPAWSKEKPPAALEKLPVIHFFCSGQLTADARTGAAMVRYFFQSEKPMPTNIVNEPGAILTKVTGEMATRTNL